VPELLSLHAIYGLGLAKKYQEKGTWFPFFVPGRKLITEIGIKPDVPDSSVKLYYPFI
jgi:hypothetical protein